MRKSGIDQLITFVYKKGQPVGFYPFTLTCALDTAADPEPMFGKLMELSPEDRRHGEPLGTPRGKGGMPDAASGSDAAMRRHRTNVQRPQIPERSLIRNFGHEVTSTVEPSVPIDFSCDRIQPWRSGSKMARHQDQPRAEGY